MFILILLSEWEPNLWKHQISRQSQKVTEGQLTLNLECRGGGSFNLSWLSLDDVECLGAGEVMRAGGDTGRGAGDDARLTEGLGDDVSTVLGDVGADDVGNGFEVGVA